MKLLHISDTHNNHRKLGNMPQADVIVHTGDFCDKGTMEEAEDFINWFCDLHYSHKIFVAGNHDDILHNATIEGLPDNVHYLCNNGVTIDGIKFYGIPMFPADAKEGLYQDFISRIPPDTKILLTHQPPYFILDEENGINYGDPFLLKQVKQTKPLLHLFGHVHKASGTLKDGVTTFSNASQRTILLDV